MRAAWGTTIATYTDSDDVVIGSTLSRRNFPFDKIEEVNGPTFTTVLVRLRPSRQKSVFDFLLEVQKASAEMIPFEHTDMSRISKLSPSAKAACECKSLLVIQPSPTFASHGKVEEEPFVSFVEVKNSIKYSYGLVIECCLTRDGLVVNVIYDPHVLSEQQVRRILLNFEDVVYHMSQESHTQQLGELRGAVTSDRTQIMAWAESFIASSALLHQAISRQWAIKITSKEAIHA